MMALRARRLVAALLLLLVADVAGAQEYQPRFRGDPARSRAEAAALGYMRTLVNAQREYKKKKGGYATSLSALVNHGSFTRRMTRTDRGDYVVSFSGRTQSYELSMTPKQFDPEHRAFFVDESGDIRVEDDKPATDSSPLLK
ncbi:MAG TPA: hypothetical protein VGQ71_02105 [Terriglobales bacterium]|jgi:hypothetical protein|nr:hypothetical protein [Terriglobales bacterium]